MKVNIAKSVFEKILKEEPIHVDLEYGGYLMVANNCVRDVIFDIKKQTGAYVELGLETLARLVPPERQKYVGGWFHKHPINGLSYLDMQTVTKLTEFWGECMTLVLQSNRKLLVLHTLMLPEIMSGTKVMVINDKYEVEIDGYL